MTSARVVRGAIAVAIAVTVAGGAAVANLRLIEGQDRNVEPLLLSTGDSSSTTSSASDPGDGPDSTDTTTTTAPPSTVLGSTTTPTATGPGGPTTTAAPVPTTSSHTVGAAGTVVLSVQGGTVTVVSVQVASGWTSATERPAGSEVEVEFRRSSDGAELSFHGRLEGGVLRVEVEDEGVEGPDD